MPSHGLENVDILEREVDFTIVTTGKREIQWNPQDEGDDAFYITQGDSGSTRIVFEIPRMVADHDMYQCDMIQIHYLNVGSSTQQSRDIYLATDKELVDDTLEIDDQYMRFSWLVGETATANVGTVHFAVHFMCVDNENFNPTDSSTYGSIIYDWSTGVCNDIQIIAGLDNSSNVVQTNSELLLKWRDELMFEPSWTQDPTSQEEDLSVLTITRQWDGKSVSSPESLRGPQGIQGIQGVQGPIGNPPELEVGTVYTQDVANFNPEVTVEYDDPSDHSKAKLNFVLPASTESVKVTKGATSELNGDTLYFWSGKKADYEALDEDFFGNNNVFTIIEDDTFEGDVDEKITRLTDQISSLTESKDSMLAVLGPLNRAVVGEGSADRDANIQQNVKINANKIEHLETRVNNIETPNSKVYKYAWYNETKTTEEKSISFPQMTSIEDPKKIYVYFANDEDGNLRPFNVNTGEINKIVNPIKEADLRNRENSRYQNAEITIQSNSYSSYPSKQKQTWWGIPSDGSGFSPDDVTWTNTDLFTFDPDNGYTDTFTPVDGYNVSAISLELDGIRQNVPLDGSPIYFENTLTDAITPDMYHGDKIRRYARIEKINDTVYLITGTSIYVEDYTSTSPVQSVYVAKPGTIYDYDYQNKYQNVTKCVEYGLTLGANSVNGKVKYISTSDEIAPIIGGSIGEPFTINAGEFLEYFKTQGMKLFIGDYLYDSTNTLYRITTTPSETDKTITLMLVSRNAVVDDYSAKLDAFNQIFAELYRIDDSKDSSTLSISQCPTEYEYADTIKDLFDHGATWAQITTSPGQEGYNAQYYTALTGWGSAFTQDGSGCVLELPLDSAYITTYFNSQRPGYPPLFTTKLVPGGANGLPMTAYYCNYVMRNNFVIRPGSNITAETMPAVIENITFNSFCRKEQNGIVYGAPVIEYDEFGIPNKLKFYFEGIKCQGLMTGNYIYSYLISYVLEPLAFLDREEPKNDTPQCVGFSAPDFTTESGPAVNPNGYTEAEARALVKKYYPDWEG